MTSLVYFIESIAPGLYLFCAAGLLFWLWRLFAARHRLATAEFELEREMAEVTHANAVTWAIGMIEIALAVAAIAFVIAPTLRADLRAEGVAAPLSPLGTGTPFITSTPGGNGSNIAALDATNTAAAIAAGGGPVLLLTAVASPTPVGTIIPGYPTPSDCNTDQAWLEIPATGQVLFDSVEVIGKANIPNFAFYKFELRGPSTGGEFAPILGEQTTPVIQKGTLGLLPLSPFQPGDYTFRLAVFDNTGTLKASCSVQVNIRERPPTPTPPGGKP